MIFFLYYNFKNLMEIKNIVCLLYNSLSELNYKDKHNLIYDLLNTSDYEKTGIIYLYDALEEEHFLKTKRVQINSKVINNYFKKYWPYVNLSLELSDVKNN